MGTTRFPGLGATDFLDGTVDGATNGGRRAYELLDLTAREAPVPELAGILAQHGGGNGAALASEMQLLAGKAGALGVRVAAAATS
jgi:hypothetical protein